jgi:protocatechuate 3,4-dioxygenase beta subunit
MRPDEWRKTRREFLQASLAAPVARLVTVAEATAQTRRLRATPACGDSGVTPSQTEGPYFKPSSPARASLLEPEATGTRIVIEGAVLTTGCAPIPRALLDFWQADDRGRYDSAGYRLRGHQFTDDSGRYRLETVVPGVYPGRTRHIHVKVQAPERPALTTQLYFPGEPMNQRDGIFDPALVVRMRTGEGARLASFDFVLEVG